MPRIKWISLERNYFMFGFMVDGLKVMFRGVLDFITGSTWFLGVLDGSDVGGERPGHRSLEEPGGRFSPTLTKSNFLSRGRELSSTWGFSLKLIAQTCDERYCLHELAVYCSGG